MEHRTAIGEDIPNSSTPDQESRTPITPGVRNLLQAQENTSSVTAGPNALPLSFCVLMVIADVVLVALAALVVLKGPRPIGSVEVVACLAALTIGAALSLVAVLLRANGVPPDESSR